VSETACEQNTRTDLRQCVGSDSVTAVQVESETQTETPSVSV